MNETDTGSSRRAFVKWLAAAGAAVGAAACSKSAPNGGPPPGPDPTPAPAPDPPPKLTTASYVVPEDHQRIAATKGYGAGLTAGPGCELTGPDVLGPFHREGAPKRKVICPPSEPGDRLEVSGRVLHHDCKTPVKGALLDIWHADLEGRYDNSSADFRLRGQVLTDDEGRYAFETIMPGRYPLDGSMRPAHVHFNVSFPGCHPLTTQLYFQGDPYLKPDDPCGVCNSGDRTLIVALTRSERGGKAVHSGTFDIVLAKG